MTKSTLAAISGLAGVCAGGLAGYILAKKLYFEPRLDAELESIKELYGAESEVIETDGDTDKEPNAVSETSSFTDFYKGMDTKPAIDYTKPEPIEDEDDDDPPVGTYHEAWDDDTDSTYPENIPEDQFGLIEDYEQIELACTDMIHLYDEDGAQLSPNDVDRFVGLDFASYMETDDEGNQLDEPLYFRNDMYETYYKIVFDLDSEYEDYR